MWLLCLQPFVDLILASFTRSSPRKAFQSEIKHVCYAAKLLNSIRNLAKCASFRGQTFPCKKNLQEILAKFGLFPNLVISEKRLRGISFRRVFVLQKQLHQKESIDETTTTTRKTFW